MMRSLQIVCALILSVSVVMGFMAMRPYHQTSHRIKLYLHTDPACHPAAQTQCETLYNGSLVIPDSNSLGQKTLAFAKEQGIGEFYIGLYNDPQNGTLMWSNCHRFIASDVSEFKIDFDSKKMCYELEVDDVELDSEDCSDREPYMCEARSVSDELCPVEDVTEYSVSVAVLANAQDCTYLCQREKNCWGVLFHRNSCIVLRNTAEGATDTMGVYRKECYDTTRVDTPSPVYDCAGAEPIRCATIIGDELTDHINGTVANTSTSTTGGSTTGVSATIPGTGTSTTGVSATQSATGASNTGVSAIISATEEFTTAVPGVVSTTAVSPTEVLGTISTTEVSTIVISATVSTKGVPAKDKPTMAPLELQQKIINITKEISVDKAKTGKERRRYISVIDNRPISVAVGTVAILVISMVVTFCVASDVLRCYICYLRMRKSCQKAKQKKCVPVTNTWIQSENNINAYIHGYAVYSDCT